MTRKPVAAALLSAALLAEEVVAGRLLSVITWYSLGYLALSLGLLGMTAGALLVHLRPEWFARGGAALAAALAAVAVALGALWLVRTHLALDVEHPLSGVARIAAVAAVIALPFAGGGAALASLLASAQRPGTLYAADLAGAAAGALLAGPLIAGLGAPRALVATALALALAAFALGARRLAAAAVLPAAFALAWPGALELRWAKDRALDPARPPLLEGWTSFAHVRAEEHRDLPPFYWAPLSGAPEAPVHQAFIRIDGEAGTAAYAFSGPRDLRFLESDVTFVPFVLRPPERVLVLGSGAGRDLASAHLAGARTVQGVEINDLLVQWLDGPLGDLSPVLRLPGVSVATGDGRAFAARTSERYDLVLASLVDTWASTGAGALSLTENALYTEEAWALFLDRLSDQGVLAFSRWFEPTQPLEIARLLALASGALRRAGVQAPRAHVAVVTRDHVAVVLVSRSAFTPAERDRLRIFSAARGARLAEEPLLLEVLDADALALDALSLREGVDLRAPTDDRPFFFLQVPPAALLSASARERFLGSGAGLLHGNVLALFAVGVAFAASMGLAVLALLGPLVTRMDALRRIPAGRRAALLGYFALLGAGFMLFEIASAERLHTMLGTPTWAVALTLAPLTLGAGLGAALSEWWPVPPRRAALLGAALIAAAAASGGAVDAVLAFPLAARVAFTSSALLVISVPLGTLLPAGLRAAREAIPWCWGVNGLASVCASGGAVLISVAFGISRAFLAAAAAYALAAVLAPVDSARPERID